MKVVSTNIGERVAVEWKGQTVETGIYKYPVDYPIFLGEEDVLNDNVINRRYHGGIDKACYLYSADHYSFWQEKYPDVKLEWGMFGENLTVTGLDESAIRIGDTYQIGSAVVQVTQPRQPCFKLGIRFGNQKVVADFWSLPYPGIYVRVLESGSVRAGDLLILLESNSDSHTVAQTFSLFRREEIDVNMISKAIADPFLAASCRQDLEKLLK